MIKAYSIGEIAFLDWIDTRTVRNSWKYIPVRFEDRTVRRDMRNGRTTRTYTERRVRVDEIKYIFNKRNQTKRLVEEMK